MSVTFRDSVIEIKNLFFKSVLTDINFTIMRGDYVGIIGPNGGGKSTLLRLLLGLLEATSGKITLFGKEQKIFKEHEKIGYVPQRVAQIDTNFPVNVAEVVEMGLAYKSGLFSRITANDKEYCYHILEKLDIYSLKNRPIGALSGGQRQRVMIARALVSRPQILILDEPNAGVDPLSQQHFYTLLKELNAKENMTILFVTHDLGVIVEDIQKVLSINQTLHISHHPRELLQCSTMSELYGINSHILCNH